MSVVIGVTGSYAAGKTVVGEYLSSKGFVYTSLSDILRIELTEEGKPTTRENLLDKGNSLRKENGPGVLAQKMVARFNPSINYFVDSIRNPKEVEELQKLPFFQLWLIDAPADMRFNRLRSRNRQGDPSTREEFNALEQRENSSDPTQQQLSAVASLADKKIVNQTSLADLFQKVDDLLLQVPYQSERPSWDMYYMDIAKVVAHRSNCIKRRVGAVLIRDNRIISTGYNGTPRGVKNCSDGGCERCRSFLTPSGTKLDECRCSHAEENAIVQSAFHGISTKGATIYTTFSPCLTCTKMIINSGIQRVVYSAEYPLGELAIQTLQESGIEIVKL